METSYMPRSASQPSQLSIMSASSSCVLLDAEDRRYARLERGLASSRTPCTSVSSNGSDKRRHRRRFRQIIAVVSLALSLFSVAAFVAMFVWVQTDSTKKPVCLPCLSIVTSPILESDPRLSHLLRMRKDGKELCCASTRQQEMQLLEMVMRRKEEETHTAVPEYQHGEATMPQTNSTRSPGTGISAHVLLGPQPAFTQQAPENKKLVTLQNWDSSLQLSHLRGVSLLQNYTLVVAVKGHYYVYGQIYYRRISTTPVYGMFTMHIYRFNVNLDDNEEELLRGVSSASGDDAKFLHTTYVGGVFELNHGDQLFVKVSNPEMISTEPKGSFLGLFKISS